MKSDPLITQLTDEIKVLFRQSSRPDDLIATYFEQATAKLSTEERVAVCAELIENFAGSPSKNDCSETPLEKSASRPLEMMVNLLFGKRLEDIDLPPEELAQKLSDSLAVVFDSLNELIDAFGTMFIRQNLNETIRMVISADLTGDAEHLPLQRHLDQIKDSLGIMDQAYRTASFVKMKEMLDELDPKSMEADLGPGVKMGPFKKAELFSIYEKRFQTLRRWLDSGRLVDSLMHEFEKSCQEPSLQKKERS